MKYYLIKTGEDSLAVMAALRSSFRISLGMANSMIANVPSELPEPFDGDMEAALLRLRRAGATVDTTPAPDSLQTSPEPEAPATPATVSAEGRHTVYLLSTPAKLALVKAVKEATGWGLKESKEWVDEGPEAGRTFPTDVAFGIRDYLVSVGFGARAVTADPNVAKLCTAAAPAPVQITKITINFPGPKRMQIIPLLKQELKMNYSSAATLAAKGGDITSFPDAATATRVAAALHSLEAVITIA